MVVCCLIGCRIVYYILMEAQPSEQIDYSGLASVVVCQQCGLTFFLLPNSADIAANQGLSSFGILIEQSEAYCLRCLQQRIRQQMREAQMLQQRYIYHKQFESSYQEHEMMERESHQQQQQQRERLKQEIAKLQQDEQEITRNLNQVKEDTNQLKDKIFQFELEEEKFWEGINKIERRTNKVEEKSLNTKFDKNQEKDVLEELSQLSVIHLFSDIVIDDNVALVQGMAMGKRAEGVDISWEEVAIGLGHLLITLNLLAMKYTYQYKLIQEIKFKGMLSEVILRKKKKRLCVLNSKQSQKQIGELLQCLLLETTNLSQYILQAESISYSQQFRIPFLINTTECKIAELYIDPYKMEERIRWNNWTKAMRYFLINFKHMITVYAINDKYL